jgi:hypothetical protein
MSPFSWSLLTLVLVFANLTAISLHAQNVVLSGALRGLVTDQRGAVVPRASVAVRNLDTGVETATETGHSRLYRFNVRNQSLWPSPRFAVFRAIHVFDYPPRVRDLAAA